MDSTILLTLITSAFVSATLLPAASEAVFIWAVQQQPHHIFLLWCTATLANSAGSLTSYGIGRLLPQRRPPSARIQQQLQRYGSPMLLLSWLPIVGDALPLAAGCLRLNFFWCTLAITCGKGLRYAFLLWGWHSLSASGGLLTL